MNTDDTNALIQQKIAALAKRRDEILALPPEQALDRILDDAQPAALVHAIPEEDLYLLAHDLGTEDALPILSLASDAQWEFFLDVDAWRRDRIDIESLTRWLDLLLRAHSRRLVRWTLEHKLELAEFYLFKSIQIMVREHDQDPSDFGDNYLTHDDTIYFRVLDEGLEAEDDVVRQKAEFHRDVLIRFLNQVAMHDHFKYQGLLMESATIIPAENEEERLRLRNVRLAEKGFLPFEEASAIYTPLRPEQASRPAGKKKIRVKAQEPLARTPQYPVRLLPDENLFTQALQASDPAVDQDQIQVEFTALCNQVISADQKTIRERDQLGGVVRKVCGYLNLGLGRLLGDRTPSDQAGPDRKRAAHYLQRVPLSDIFRYGYGLALELKQTAQRWHRGAWVTRKTLPLNFWDEHWMGVLGGLLLKKPLFFDNYRTGVLYREFETQRDIQVTAEVLESVRAMDGLLAAVPDQPRIPGEEQLTTYKNYLLTLWARSVLGLTRELLPVPLDAFRTFFEGLFSGSDENRHIPAETKESFLGWLADQTGRTVVDLSQDLGARLEILFDEIEQEYTDVEAADLDPRFILLFHVERE